MNNQHRTVYCRLKEQVRRSWQARRLLPIVALFSSLLFLMGGMLVPAEPTPAPAPNPHTVRGAFLNAWETAGPARLGPPRSDPLWLDDELVQLFDAARLRMVTPGADSTIRVQPQPAGWLDTVPSLLRVTPTAARRAHLTVPPGAPTAQGLPVAQPLQPFTLTLTLDAPATGRAVLHLFDADLRPAGITPFMVRDGAASITVLPHGTLGPQWAVVIYRGQIAAAYSRIFTLDATTAITTGNPDYDLLYPTIRDLMLQATVNYELDGTPVRGYRSPDNPLIWLRDHVTSTLDAFRRAQNPDGSFPDVLAHPGLGVAALRKDPESDLEFLFIQGVYEAWQMTGDDAWLRTNLDAMRRALTYITSDPLRWDAEYGLVRRPYTIDMWDFQYGPSTQNPVTGLPSPRHWIDEQTIWGIFHGDNTGLAYAMRLLAEMERHLGNDAEADAIDEQRHALTQRIREVSWNGRFFTHFVPLEGELDVPGLDTDEQISLSNTYALNREILDRHEARRIIDTYFHRRDFERSFAEWYSIDPPFPSGSFGMGGRPGDDPGEYVNGGIMPLVGGELARGAFRYGVIAYGLDILQRYAALLRMTGESYLWYYPTGAPGISGPDTLATDGWGASAMLGAFIEGAAGVRDESYLYRELRLSPHWAADPTLTAVRVVTRYAASDAYVAYTWERQDTSLHLELTGTWEYTRIYLLLPPGSHSYDPDDLTVEVNGRLVSPRLDTIDQYQYVRVHAEGGNVQLAVAWD
jgi:hypothetical protein